jgi:hypothetical protein
MDLAARRSRARAPRHRSCKLRIVSDPPAMTTDPPPKRPSLKPLLRVLALGMKGVLLTFVVGVALLLVVWWLVQPGGVLHGLVEGP